MSRKDDIINFWGRVIFMVLFFLLVSSFCEKTFQPKYHSCQYELSSVLNTSTMNAVAVTDIQLPLFEKSWISFIDKSNFSFYNEKLKILSDSEKITQRIISLQKTQRLIKTPILNGFYRHLFPIDNDELPVLS